MQYGKVDAAALVRMADVGQAKWLVDNVNGNIPNGLSTPLQIAYAENKGPVNVPVNYGKAEAMPALSDGGPYGVGSVGGATTTADGLGGMDMLAASGFNGGSTEPSATDYNSPSAWNLPSTV